MKALWTYWPEITNVNKFLLALQLYITVASSIILIVKTSVPAALILGFNIGYLLFFTALTFAAVKDRHHRQQHKENTND